LEHVAFNNLFKIELKRKAWNSRPTCRQVG